MSMNNFFLTFFGIFTLTLCLIKFLYPIATKIGLIDHPDDRKQHKGKIPLIGGIAIFCSFLISSLVLNLNHENSPAFIVSLSIITLLGVIDDYNSLSFKIKLIFQLIAILILAFFAKTYFNSLGSLLLETPIQLNYIAIPFTVFSVIGIINAFNMMDGIDGLSASLAIVALVALYISGGYYHPVYAQLLLIFIASLSAFLLINLFSKNKIFMGDAGSMLIGLVISWFIIIFSQGSMHEKIISPVTALWIIAIPLMDTVCIMLRRIMKGQSPFSPDREHLHHIFLRAGYSDKQTLLIVVILATFLAATGVVANSFHVPEWLMFYLFLALFIFYFQMIQHSWLFMKWLKVIHAPSCNHVAKKKT